MANPDINVVVTNKPEVHIAAPIKAEVINRPEVSIVTPVAISNWPPNKVTIDDTAPIKVSVTGKREYMTVVFRSHHVTDGPDAYIVAVKSIIVASLNTKQQVSALFPTSKATIENENKEDHMVLPDSLDAVIGDSFGQADARNAAKHRIVLAIAKINNAGWELVAPLKFEELATGSGDNVWNATANGPAFNLTFTRLR